ncbi:WRKY transcription factor 44-like [Tripterygium wilfordii]|uniref:WRKY transcription factor 44-like n=1 Tax=Tripterygium wilfordii TaxID=458696 RepID=A0A7J7DTD7_TRIWF|nr:WRKY transcription factor 44-like [Tripterygium wilfordii]
MVSSAPGGALYSKAKFSGTLLNFNSNHEASKLDTKATMVYKPQANFVSKMTVSLLANMGNFNSSYQQRLPSVETHVPCPNKDIQNVPSQLGKTLQIASHTETDQSIEPQKIALQNLEEVPNPPPLAPNGIDHLMMDITGESMGKSKSKEVNIQEVTINALMHLPKLSCEKGRNII